LPVEVRSWVMAVPPGSLREVRGEPEALSLPAGARSRQRVTLQGAECSEPTCILVRAPKVGTPWTNDEGWCRNGPHNRHAMPSPSRVTEMTCEDGFTVTGEEPSQCETPVRLRRIGRSPTLPAPPSVVSCDTRSRAQYRRPNSRAPSALAAAPSRVSSMRSCAAVRTTFKRASLVSPSILISGFSFSRVHSDFGSLSVGVLLCLKQVKPHLATLYLVRC